VVLYLHSLIRLQGIVLNQLSTGATLPYVSTAIADHSGRAVHGMRSLRPLEHWNLWFESHSRHGCLSVFVLGSGLAMG
jgi:hypothetical protein